VKARTLVQFQLVTLERKAMKTIIAGSRIVNSYAEVKKAIVESGFDIDTVISGHAQGADHWGELYAQQNNIDLVIFPANWGKYGKSAGMIRNEKMADYADALIAIWDGESRGTLGMIKLAQKKGLKVFVYNMHL
jgi:hypothetical protein